MLSKGQATSTESSSDWEKFSDEPMNFGEMPTRVGRIYSMFKLWNIIHYFYPFGQLDSTVWNNALPRFLSNSLSSVRREDYIANLMEMTALLHDGHIRFTGENSILGWRNVPCELRTTSEGYIVSRLLDSLPGIHVGDKILEVDGATIKNRIAVIKKYTPRSTIANEEIQIERFMLAGDSEITQVKIDQTGTERTFRLPRSQLGIPELRQRRNGPTWTYFNGNILYIDIIRASQEELLACLDSKKKNRGIILDLRGYPEHVLGPLLGNLFATRTVCAERFSVPIVSSPDSGTRWEYCITLAPLKKIDAKIPVIALINGEMISQAEENALLLEGSGRVKFLGTPTAGTNGHVTSLALPGNIRVRFTGREALHGDRRSFQGIGILPNIFVADTRQSLAAQRDIQLDSAVALLSQIQGYH